jgi:hypothetical protein
MKPNGSGTPSPRSHILSSLIVPTFALVLAFLQLLLFVPVVNGGRSVDVPLWPGSPLDLAFRVDALSLVFGVAWALSAALASARLWGITPNSLRVVGPLCVMILALGAAAYARHPLLLYAAWEAAGISLWLALSSMRPGGLSVWSALTLHASGWPLLLMLILGVVYPFAPPFGGDVQPWPAVVALSLVVVALIRSGSWPFGGWVRVIAAAYGGAGEALTALFCAAAPILLAKALVAAPWDSAGVWVVTLLGTASLVGLAAARLSGLSERTLYLPGAVSAATVTGFGLASGSPLAAAGALAIMLVGLVYAALGTERPPGAAAALAGGAVGVWLVSQGALSLGYGLAGAVLLPALLLCLAAAAYRLTQVGKYTYSVPWVAAMIALALAASYPQLVVETVLRNGVSAMAGGVGTLSALSTDWGVGLAVRSAQGVVTAALPSTGIALAVFLSAVCLYWLKRLARGIVGAPESAGQE